MTTSVLLDHCTGYILNRSEAGLKREGVLLTGEVGPSRAVVVGHPDVALVRDAMYVAHLPDVLRRGRKMLRTDGIIIASD